ncbi:MAG: hypothetical protein K9L57_07415 [Spirochaetaceae bacterium]|nr:hypothetical protein [Spirochaetaceae bacterium]
MRVLAFDQRTGGNFYGELDTIDGEARNVTAMIPANGYFAAFSGEKQLITEKVTAWGLVESYEQLRDGSFMVSTTPQALIVMSEFGILEPADRSSNFIGVFPCTEDGYQRAQEIFNRDKK